jgi:hypothetical protein
MFVVTFVAWVELRINSCFVFLPMTIWWLPYVFPHVFDFLDLNLHGGYQVVLCVFSIHVITKYL